MQVHLESSLVGKISTHCNGSDPSGPFAIVTIGAMELFFLGDGDFDALMIAVADARKIWQAATSGRQHVFTGGDDRCDTCGLRERHAIHAPAIDSEAWTCAGCSAPCIGGRPEDSRCKDCRAAATALLHAVATGTPVIITEDVPCPAHHPEDGMRCEVKGAHDQHAYIPFPADGTPPVTWTDDDQREHADPGHLEDAAHSEPPSVSDQVRAGMRKHHDSFAAAGREHEMLHEIDTAKREMAAPRNAS